MDLTLKVVRVISNKYQASAMFRPWLIWTVLWSVCYFGFKHGNHMPPSKRQIGTYREYIGLSLAF